MENVGTVCNQEVGIDGLNVKFEQRGRIERQVNEDT